MLKYQVVDNKYINLSYSVISITIIEPQKGGTIQGNPINSHSPPFNSTTDGFLDIDVVI